MTKGQALEKVLRAVQVVPKRARLRLNWADRDDPVEWLAERLARRGYVRESIRVLRWLPKYDTGLPRRAPDHILLRQQQYDAMQADLAFTETRELKR